MNNTEIVCLCGSSKFYEVFDKIALELTLTGRIVLSILKLDKKVKLSENDRLILHDIHKKKIDMCNWVYVIDVGGYIGESTRSEIEYARKKGKEVRFLSEGLIFSKL